MFAPHPPRPRTHRRVGATALALLVAAVMAVPAGLGHHVPNSAPNNTNQLGEQAGFPEGFEDHGFTFEGIPRGVDNAEWPSWCRNDVYLWYANNDSSSADGDDSYPGTGAAGRNLPAGQTMPAAQPYGNYSRPPQSAQPQAPPVGDIFGVESVAEVVTDPADPDTKERVFISEDSGNLYHILQDAAPRSNRGWVGPEPDGSSAETDNNNGTLLGPDGWVVGRLQAPVYDEPLAYELWVNDNDATNTDNYNADDDNFNAMLPSYRRASYCVWGRPSFDDQGPWLFIGTGFPAQGIRWRGGEPYGDNVGSPLDLSLWYHDAFNARYGDPTGPELQAEVQDILIQGAHERFPAVRAWFDYNVSDTAEDAPPFVHGYAPRYSANKALLGPHLADHKPINAPGDAITYRNPDPTQWNTQPYIEYPYAYDRDDPMPIVQEHWVSFDQFAERFGWPYDTAWGTEQDWDHTSAFDPDLGETNQTYNNRPDPIRGYMWYFDTDPRPQAPDGQPYPDVGPEPGVPVTIAPYGTLDKEWDGPILGADHDDITLIHVDRGAGYAIDLFYIDRDDDGRVSDGDVRLTEFLDFKAGSHASCVGDGDDDDDCGWGEPKDAVAADGPDNGPTAGDTFLDSFWMKEPGTPPDNIGIGDFRIHHEEEADRTPVAAGDRDAPVEGDPVTEVTHLPSQRLRWMDLANPKNRPPGPTADDVDPGDGFYVDMNNNGRPDYGDHRIRHRDLPAGTIEYYSTDNEDLPGATTIVPLPPGVYVYRANATNGWPDGDLRDSYYLAYDDTYTRVTPGAMVRLHHPDWRPGGTGTTVGITPEATTWDEYDLVFGEPGYRECGQYKERDDSPYPGTYYWPECYDDFPHTNPFAATARLPFRIYYDEPSPDGGPGEYDVCMVAYSQTAREFQDTGQGKPVNADRWNSDVECQTITVTNIPPVATLTTLPPSLGKARERTFLGSPYDPDGRDSGYGIYPECIDEYIWQFDDEDQYTLGWDHKGDPRWPDGLLNPTHVFQSGGPKRIAFTVRDCNGALSEPAVRFLNLPRNEPPVFDRVPPQAHTTESRFCFAVRAWDPEGQPLRSLTHDGVPAGATPSSTDGNTQSFNFCWTPEHWDVGHHVVVFHAVDSLDAVTTLEVPIEIRFPSLDTDGDGAIDVTDECPADVEAPCDGSLVGNGGTAWRPVDEDGDGNPDGRDFDGDGKADTLIDEDDDGIPDGVDVDGDGAIDFTLDLDTAMELAQADGANARDLLLRGAPEATSKDTDDDGVVDALDNCPRTPNAGQGDLDLDGIGDLCDADVDGDGIVQVSPLADTHLDNCPHTGNPDQADRDGDGIGDLCDSDTELGRSNLAKLDSRRLTSADCDDCAPPVQVPDGPDTESQRLGAQGIVGMVAGVAVLVLVSLGLTMWAVRRWR